MYLLKEMLKEALTSLNSYKLRSFLTILGIIIGIVSVVVMISIGEGAQRQVEAQFANLGSNLITIRAGSPLGYKLITGNVQTLTFDDANAIALLNVTERAAYSKNGSAQVVYDRNNFSVSIYGVSENYFEVMNLKIDKGIVFEEKDIHSGTTYAVIGSNVRTELFKNEDPIGKVIRIKNIPFKVIGLLKEYGANSSFDDSVIVPFSSYLRKLSRSKFPKVVSTIAINVKDEMYLSYAEQKITELLRARHKLKNNQDDDFRIMNMKELVDTIKSNTRIFSILLASIASISLIVGSIGIMNMMLVSVTERTREIGLRKAIGAKEKTILQQFLLESLVISFLGSMVGLILGLILAQVAGYFLEMDLQVSINAILLSVIVSIIVGISSGLFPAKKASKLNPIDALRYE